MRAGLSGAPLRFTSHSQMLDEGRNIVYQNSLAYYYAQKSFITLTPVNKVYFKATFSIVSNVNNVNNFYWYKLKSLSWFLADCILLIKSRIAKVAYTQSTMQPHIVAVTCNANLKRLKNF
jgi:hypothetical protein